MPIHTAAIVEDNRSDASNLTGMLEKHFPTFKITGVLHSYEEAIEQLPAQRPDLLFLDINLPGGYTGFDILKACSPLEFNIIFTTAYDKYAIDAIRASALDYLLKPFDLGMLTQTIERVLEKLNSGSVKTSSQQDIEDVRSRIGTHAEKIMLHSGGSILFINPDEVLRLEANGAYSVFILADGQKIVASYNLHHYEGELSKNHFFRTHRSFIINVNKVKSLKRNNNGGLLTLEDGAEINITKEKLDEFILLFRKEL
jgi:two-component system, LytTR family, response regulator